MLPQFSDNNLKRFFHNVFNPSEDEKEWSTVHAWDTVPAVNVKESKAAYELEVAAPGLKKKDFNIEVEDNQLVIWAEHQDEHKEDKKNFMRREFSYTQFRRSFALPDHVDTDKIKAKHKGGVLHVEIPKTEKAKPKSIDIE